MILPDVNVLIYALRTETPAHEIYFAWLYALLSGSEELALHDAVLAGVVRVATDRRIMTPPTPLAVALDFVDDLTSGRRVRWLPTGPGAWQTLRELGAGDSALGGRLIPDAHLAALALTHGCRIATADRGFGRFPGLRFFDPAA